MKLTAAAQAVIIRRFVSFVEDNACITSEAALSQLLQAEQDYKRGELVDANVVGDRVEIL